MLGRRGPVLGRMGGFFAVSCLRGGLDVGVGVGLVAVGFGFAGFEGVGFAVAGFAVATFVSFFWVVADFGAF